MGCDICNTPHPKWHDGVHIAQCSECDGEFCEKCADHGGLDGAPDGRRTLLCSEHPFDTGLLERIYHPRIEEAAKEYADHVRRTLIIPFCDRHHLTFVSGNGTYGFWPPKPRNGYQALYPEDLPIKSEFHEKYEAVWAALDADLLPGGNPVGLYIDDYTSTPLRFF